MSTEAEHVHRTCVGKAYTHFCNFANYVKWCHKCHVYLSGSCYKYWRDSTILKSGMEIVPPFSLLQEIAILYSEQKNYISSKWRWVSVQIAIHKMP